MALDGAEDGFLDFRLLRHAGSNEVDPGVKSERSLLEMFVGFVKEPGVLNGEIDQSRERTKRHGMPTVAAERAGSNGSALPFLVACLRVFDGTAGFHVDRTGPRDGGIWLRGDEFTGGAIENVKETILGCVKKDFSRSLVDGEVGEDDGFGGIEIPRVTGSFLVMPDVFAGVRL